MARGRLAHYAFACCVPESRQGGHRRWAGTTAGTIAGGHRPARAVARRSQPRPAPPRRRVGCGRHRVGRDAHQGAAAGLPRTNNDMAGFIRTVKTR